MRTPLDSPFSPGSDTVPRVWAGRTVQLSDWRDIVRPRRLAGIHERGRTILGEAGLGKSTLVRRIAAEAQDAGDWVTQQLRIPSGADPLKRVASALLELAVAAGLSHKRDARLGVLLARVQQVSMAGVSLSLSANQDAPDPYTSLSELLVEVGRAARRRGDTMVLVHIDEIQNIADANVLSQLLIALGDALVHEELEVRPGAGADRVAVALPIAVYLSGLPEFDDVAGARQGATFVRRFKKTTLAPIEDGDLSAALQPFVTGGWEILGNDGRPTRIFMESDAQKAIVDLCQGEPFLFQLAGERAWYADSGDLITREHVLRGWRHARDEAEAHVERIIERLPQRERDFLVAMAELEPEDRTITKISRSLGHERATEDGPIAQRLDTKRGILARGKPYSFRHRAVGAYLTTEWPDVS
ncbi:hypothetical protein EDF22_1271 [Rathayibacter sp. PhB127]|uniref:ATP-binding protein n=1 Tax=Rathayibacter sp. PhB127 TaxID=2485176 RepID=UPI000F4D0BC3|nr:ATP-binding protein [Rathayibacter sp. PhB127]ROS29530.1 hypothetical protein EDF22_1271 [Rathayibacter sp. PhB127]